MASHIERRKFLATLGGTAAWPLTVRAQQPAVPVIGFLGSTSAEMSVKSLEAFRKGFSETGYVEGRNVWTRDNSVASHWTFPSRSKSARIKRRRVEAIRG